MRVVAVGTKVAICSARGGEVGLAEDDCTTAPSEVRVGEGWVRGWFEGLLKWWVSVIG